MGVDEPHSGLDESDQGPDRHPQPSDADRPADNTRPREAGETRFRQECGDDLQSACHQLRQREIADKIFAVLRSDGHWPAVYIDDMQKVLGHYDPAESRAT